MVRNQERLMFSRHLLVVKADVVIANHAIHFNVIWRMEYTMEAHQISIEFVIIHPLALIEHIAKYENDIRLMQ